jgi:hypothetical protein
VEILVEGVELAQRDLMEIFQEVVQVVLDCQHFLEILVFLLLMEHRDQQQVDGLQVAAVVVIMVQLQPHILVEVLEVEEMAYPE